MQSKYDPTLPIFDARPRVGGPEGGHGAVLLPTLKG
jgi:hypothetical protein